VLISYSIKSYRRELVEYSFVENRRWHRASKGGSAYTTYGQPWAAVLALLACIALLLIRDIPSFINDMNIETFIYDHVTVSHPSPWHCGFELTKHTDIYFRRYYHLRQAIQAKLMVR
jgi:amino acid permease